VEEDGRRRRRRHGDLVVVVDIHPNQSAIDLEIKAIGWVVVVGGPH
jgi:hypothetical protein